MLRVTNTTHLDFPWESLDGMLKGISAIDTLRMAVISLEDAEAFILSYGYDMSRPADCDELHRIQAEAIGFIDRCFLAPGIAWADLGAELLDITIPGRFYDPGFDARHLLVTASTGNGLEQRWACAILKVMHTLCHISNTVLFRHFEEAQAQILARYHKALSYADNGDVILGLPGDLQLTLAGFDVKDEKSRDSMLIKLLCKRENVAEELYDMIGVRIVTHTPAEAMLALEILRRSKILLFPNLIPSRSRNSLIDVDAFKVEYQEIMEGYRLGEASVRETLNLIQDLTTPALDAVHNRDNVNSLATYRAIHLTERQLIRFKYPGSREETRFFFPYEIQIVDKDSADQNRDGSSAHSLYKQNQLVQARRRVLGPLFIALRRQK